MKDECISELVDNKVVFKTGFMAECVFSFDTEKRMVDFIDKATCIDADFTFQGKPDRENTIFVEIKAESLDKLKDNIQELKDLL